MIDFHFCWVFSSLFDGYHLLQVSWIRRRDFQLLTVGLSTYSSDDRFLVEHARHMGHWSLRIKSVRDEDKGLYECQLSIHPTQSIFVELRVVGKLTTFNFGKFAISMCCIYMYCINMDEIFYKVSLYNDVEYEYISTYFKIAYNQHSWYRYTQIK